MLFAGQNEAHVYYFNIKLVFMFGIIFFKLILTEVLNLWWMGVKPSILLKHSPKRKEIADLAKVPTTLNSLQKMKETIKCVPRIN